MLVEEDKKTLKQLAMAIGGMAVITGILITSTIVLFG